MYMYIHVYIVEYGIMTTIIIMAYIRIAEVRLGHLIRKQVFPVFLVLRLSQCDRWF